jgi:hypothetical protein
MSASRFASYQAHRRRKLWSLLGDLPWEHKPAVAKLLRCEDREDFTLERLVLDLNGIEAVPAVLLVPHKRQAPAPGLLFIHSHRGLYDIGKEELLQGTDLQPPYARVCAEKGVIVLAIDSWCFGERRHDTDGRRGEEEAYRLFTWKGHNLFGLMMFDEFRALDYLASRPEVDPRRLGVVGMSMGATKSWWLAALDPRVAPCVDICCLTDYAELIKERGLTRHGIYYYVPSLLKHFQTATINELIVPRPRLSMNGRWDPLTPAAGVEKIRDHLLPLYRQHGRELDCRIELLDCAHVETPRMRELAVQWIDHHLLRQTST